MPYLIGLDIGTSSVKAVLIDETGHVVDTCAPEYDFDSPRPNWAETDPEVWWTATIEAIKTMVSKAGGSAEIAGVGLSGQMHGLVLLDAAGKPVRPCIMWNDQRTAAQCETITRRIGAGKVLQLTGNPVLTGFTAPKILWVKENEPQAFQRGARVLLPKDYIRYRLSGEQVGEVSDASGTSLLDVANRRWSDEMVEATGFPRAWLPEITESDAASAQVSAQAAKLTGLAEGTPIAGGGADQAAQAVGTGIIEEGLVSATLGTSGVVFAASENYRVEPEGRLHAFCHAVPGMWQLMGVMLSAAGSFQWYRNTLGREEMAREGAGGPDAYDQLIEDALKAPPGAEGLVFLPYLSGERTPHPDPNARGAFVGLSRRHEKGHLTRAVLEGVTFGMRDSLELMRNLKLTIREVRASGGGTKSAFWRQMIADIFGTTIKTVNATEGAAYGAAVLGGVAAGVFPSVREAVAQTLKVTGATEPDHRTQAVYDAFYPRYRALYPVLKDEFAALAGFVEEHG